MIGDRIENYFIESKLNAGGFGKVYRAIQEDLKVPVAIKIIESSRLKLSKEKHQLEVELQILESLSHPNIIQFIEYIRTNSQHFIVTELADEGDLLDFINRRGHISEAEGRQIFRQIVAGVEFLHLNGIYHRDLKLENFVICNSVVKIIDFGLSKRMEDVNFDLLKTKCGSIQYMDVTQMKKRPYAYSGEVADLWSLGVILFHLLVGKLPFENCDELSLLINTVNSRGFKLPSTLSEEAKRLLTVLLEPKVNKRISLSEMKCHPWFIGEEIYSFLDSRFYYDHRRWPQLSYTDTVDGVTDITNFELQTNAEQQDFRFDAVENSSRKLSVFYKIMLCQHNNKLLSKSLAKSHRYVCKALRRKAKEEPEEGRKILKVFEENLIGFSGEPDWEFGVQVTSEVESLECILEFFNKQVIKAELVNASEFKFSCYQKLSGEEQASRFDLEVFSDIDTWIIQLRNVSFPIFKFIVLCREIFRLCGGSN